MNYIDKILNAGFKFKQEEKKYFSTEKYHLVCPKGHNIFTRLSNLADRLNKRSSQGCSECHELELQQESLKTTLGHLPEGFKIVGSYRKEVNRKEARTVNIYQFECNLGHPFEKENGQCQNLSCPTCNADIHMGQERTREIFQQIFNKKFKAIRPNWLKNPKTNRNLELDGYNKDLNIAFEFQGRQHTSSNTQFGEEHYEQVERDKFKKETCEKLGVKLIEVHQPPQYEEKKFVKNVLEQIKEQINFSDYSITDFDEKTLHFGNLKFDGTLFTVKEFFDYLQNEPKANGYSCLTTDFHTYVDKITMCCPEGHNYATTVTQFKNSIEGKKGRSIPCSVCYEATGEAKQVIDINFCREEGKKHGLELLSTDYENVNQELEWKDSNGNIIRLEFRKLQRRKLVKKPNNKGIDLEYCREKGKEFGLELLSTEYINVHEKMLWKDENGNEVELYLRQLQRSKKNDPKPKTGITTEFCREEGRKYGLELLSTEYKNVNEKLLWKKADGSQIELNLRQIQRSKTGKF